MAHRLKDRNPESIKKNQTKRVVVNDLIAQPSGMTLPVPEPTEQIAETPPAQPVRIRHMADPPAEVKHHLDQQPSVDEHFAPAPKLFVESNKQVSPRSASDFTFRTRIVRSHSGDLKVKVTELVFPEDG